MIIELLLIALAVGTAASVTWNAIRRWLGASRAAMADLIKTSLANGNVEVISIGLNSSGHEIARKKWQAKAVDAELSRMFGATRSVRITI